MTRIKNKKRVKIENVLVDNGYSETLAIKPEDAKKLDFVKNEFPDHDMILSNGVRTQEYSYKLEDKDDVIVCELVFRGKKGQKN